MKGPWLLIGALLLAGCSGTPSEQDAVTAGEAGVIRGLVIDPSITPVAEVVIRIKSIGAEAKSDAEGTFLFTDLEPGTYLLEASKAGYATVQTSARVEAGVARPPIVKVQMEAAPELLPYALPDTYTGWIACEAIIGSFLQPCDAGTGAFNEPDNTLFLQGADRPTDAIQVEMVWEAQQMVGERLTQTIGSCDDGTYCNPYAGENFLCQNWGASPLWCRLTANGGQGNGHFCCAEGLATQGHGKSTGTGVGIHVGADCSLCADPVDPAVGIGVVFEQEVTAYLWSFYNFEPAEGWLFSEDGEPVPPDA